MSSNKKTTYIVFVRLILVLSLITPFTSFSANNPYCDPKSDDCYLLKPDQFPLLIKPQQENSSIYIEPFDYRIEKETDPNFINIKVSARINNNNRSILYRDQSVLVKDNRTFTIVIAIPKSTHKKIVVLTVVDFLGKWKPEKFYIKYSR
jgi:hypothetical protein